MAIQETGLGWYADEDWLMDQTGTIAQLGSSGGALPNQPIPNFVMTSSTIQNGFKYMESSGGQTFYASATTDDVYIFRAPRPNSSTKTIYVCSKTQGAECYVGYANPGSGVDGPRTLTGYDNVYDFYYIEAAYTGSNTYTFYVEEFSSRDAGFDYINQHSGSSALFEKSSSGYTVACLVKWRESLGGDVYVSPVLISSENSNTFWNANGNVPIQQLTEHSFDGMNFFMRLSKQFIADNYSSETPSVEVLDYSESAPLTADLLFGLIANASSLGVGYPPQDEDPYGPGGTTEPGGGDPNFDDTDDPIPDSTPPTYSFAASGFCRVYNPDLTQLSRLASYMWTDQTFLQTVINHLKQLLENPVDAVISLSMLPINIHNGDAEEVKIMYIPTGVYMPPATKQIEDVDCGTLLIEKRYDSALDFNPYTKVSLFLPFIGMVDLDTDEVMGKEIHIKYRVDIVSGACVAKVLVGGSSNDKCLYQFSGDCSISMPLNSADFSAYRAAFIQAAKAVVMGAAAAGSAVDSAVEAAAVESQTAGAASEAVQSTGLVPVTGSGGALVPYAGGTIPQPAPETGGVTVDVGKFGDILTGIAANTVGAVLGSKIAFQHSSGFSGNSGMLGIRRPYVVIKRPRMANPGNYGSYNGRPSMMYLSLAPLKGFTQVQKIHLTGFSATNPELSEIGRFLESGVIL